jgi:hypothetical protein
MNKENQKGHLGNDIKLDDLLAISANQGKNFSSISALFQQPTNKKKKSINNSHLVELKEERMSPLPSEKLNETLKASRLESEFDFDERSFHLKDELKETSHFNVEKKNPISSPPFVFGGSTIKPQKTVNKESSLKSGNFAASGNTGLRDKIMKDNISPIAPMTQGSKISKKIDFEDSSVLEDDRKITGKLTFTDKSLDEEKIAHVIHTNTKMNHSTDVTKTEKFTEQSPEGRDPKVVQKTIPVIQASLDRSAKITQTTKKKNSMLCFCGPKKV